MKTEPRLRNKGVTRENLLRATARNDKAPDVTALVPWLFFTIDALEGTTGTRRHASAWL